MTESVASLDDEIDVSKLFTTLIEDTDKPKAKRKSKETLASKDTSYGIVFEGPSKAELMKAAREPATPMQDGAGRSRYVVTRLCWCAADAAVENDCRFHSPTEAGWATCPAKPMQYEKKGYEGKEPKQLWVVNPDFGKPKDKVVEQPEVSATEPISTPTTPNTLEPAIA